MFCPYYAYNAIWKLVVNQFFGLKSTWIQDDDGNLMFRPIKKLNELRSILLGLLLHLRAH